MADKTELAKLMEQSVRLRDRIAWAAKKENPESALKVYLSAASRQQDEITNKLDNVIKVKAQE